MASGVLEQPTNFHRPTYWCSPIVVTASGNGLSDALHHLVRGRAVTAFHHKVDIEGYELRFLRAGDETLREFRPPMLIEIEPLTLACFGATEEQLQVGLHELQYRLFDLHREGSGPVIHPLESIWVGRFWPLRASDSQLLSAL